MITYKSKREIDKMRLAGRVIVQIFDSLLDWVRPGVRTDEIDAKVEALIIKEGCRPSFKGLYGFPASICASINEEIVHGIPGDRVLRDGDLFTVDVGVIHRGYHADAARSYAVGSVHADVSKLASATASALNSGLAACKVGNRLSDVARAVETHGRSSGFGIVEEYVGHGIGTQLHEEPKVPNYVSPGLLKNDLVLRAGLVLAIEPMFNLGTARTKTHEDGWTVITADGKCSAHFEDTVAVTENGPEILTRPENGGAAIWPGL